MHALFQLSLRVLKILPCIRELLKTGEDTTSVLHVVIFTQHLYLVKWITYILLQGRTLIMIRTSSTRICGHTLMRNGPPLCFPFSLMRSPYSSSSCCDGGIADVRPHSHTWNTAFAGVSDKVHQLTDDQHADGGQILVFVARGHVPCISTDAGCRQWEAKQQHTASVCTW